MTLPVKFSAEGNEAFTSINEHNCAEQIIQQVVVKSFILEVKMALSFGD